MDLQTLTTKLLSFSIPVLTIANSFAQEQSPIARFDLIGNLNAQLKPGQSMKIVVSATATGTGRLEFKLERSNAAFDFGFDSKSVFCESICDLSDTLFFKPTSQHYGEHEFKVVARFFENGTLIQERNRRIRISVIPKMQPEPAFTQGTFNELCWRPFDKDASYNLIRVPSSLQRKTGPVTSSESEGCEVLQGLPEGVRLGYYVVRTPLSGQEANSVKSNVVYSVQDNTPPPRVSVTNFSVSQAGAVTLRWPLQQDGISFVAKYVISRKQVAPVVTDFVRLDTVDFFPVSDIAPANYYPVIAKRGQSLYTDTEDTLFVPHRETVTILELPKELKGTTMIRTGLRDLWAEADDFLSFQLAVPSYVYVAFDPRIDTLPLWLTSNFRFAGLRQVLTDKNAPKFRGLKVFKSTHVLPAGRVTLGGNFADGAVFKEFADLMYVVFVKPVDGSLPLPSKQLISYTDSLGSDHDLQTFKYKVDAIDAADNDSEGLASGPVILDLNGRCKPIVNRWFVFEDERGAKFGRGLSNTICIVDPETLPECRGFRATDSLRFQAVRDLETLFSNHRPQDEGKSFFDSGWIAVDDLPVPFCYQFDLLPEGQGPNFVNGHAYLYRVQAKDVHGNLSIWSDTVSAVQDFFPAGDISNLQAETELFPGGEDGCINLSWDAAFDPNSGVDSYLVFRSEDDGNSFTALDTISGNLTAFCDTLSRISSNKIVQYKIGSVDRVGNLRSIDDSNWQVSLRALVGPEIFADLSQSIRCPSGLTGVTGDSVSLGWQNFDIAGVAGFQVEIESFLNQQKTVKVVAAPVASRIRCPLPGGDGLYGVRVRAFYSNKDTTIYSNTLVVKKKTRLRAVENLTAVQDSRATGDIIVSWSHPDSTDIVEYQLFTWREGESPPQVPTVSLPGDSLRWVQKFAQDSLVVYQCNFYEVRAFDCFGLQSEKGAVVSQYPNRPPVFDASNTTIEGNTITVCWQRPFPRTAGSGAFDAFVEVFQDSLTIPPFVSESVFKDTCFKLLNALPMHTYLFRVREVLLANEGQSCAETFASPFSNTLVVPFDNLPVPVDFVAQALPVPPDSVSGSVFLSWQGYPEVAVSAFVVNWKSAGRNVVADSTLVLHSDTVRVSGLELSQSYGFTVTAIDSLDQRSLTTTTRLVGFEPKWLFTPRPQAFDPVCFRDGVTLDWAWVDERLVPTDSTFGADSVMVQLSIDPQFGFKVTQSNWLSLRKAQSFRRETDYPFASDQNDVLYARVRAKDRWGHVSPWSSDYQEFGKFSGNFDIVPPEIAACFIDSVTAPFFVGPDTVDVFLHWNEVKDQCSGVRFYEVERNGQVVGRDSTRAAVHNFADRRLVIDSDFFDTQWQVHAVDSVGNRQVFAVACSLEVELAPPTASRLIDKNTICWDANESNSGAPQIFYVIEVTNNPEFFGNPFATERAGPLDSLCYEFKQNWQPVVFWRIKAQISAAFSSAWSQTFSMPLDSLGNTFVSRVSSLQLPQEFALRQNYPNPFNPTTTIRFAVPEKAGRGLRVVLEIFNLTGQKVRTLIDEEKPPGEFTVQWDGRNDFGAMSSSGLYVYRMRAGSFVKTEKMILLK
ncbi:MAG: FlgD immunoglobulin-like domain containing protein [bacterium]